MSHELLDYRYHARDLQLLQLWQKCESTILDNSDLLRPQLVTLETLLYTPKFFLPSALDRFFKSPQHQTEILSSAIGFRIEANFVKFLYELLIQTASHRSSLDIELDQSFEYQHQLPGYNMFFASSETLAQITTDSMHQGSDHLLKSIDTQTPIPNPRRDIAFLMHTAQPTLVPGEQIVTIPSAVEGVGLKLVFPPDQNFAKRFVYIHSLQ